MGKMRATENMRTMISQSPSACIIIACLLTGPLIWVGKIVLGRLLPNHADSDGALLIPISFIISILWCQNFLIRLARSNLRSISLGCGNVPVFPHKDPILGLDWVLESKRAMAVNTIMDQASRRFDLYGNTHYNLALGRWLLQTQEPENLKAILGTCFDDWPIAGPRQWAVLPLIGSKSVFASNGTDWHDARAIIRPAFVRDQVADMACLGRHAQNLLAAMPAGKKIDVQRLVQDMTMDSTTDFMLGYSTGLLTGVRNPEAVKFLHDFDWAGHASIERAMQAPILLQLPHRRLTQARNRMQSFIRFYVRKALEETQPDEIKRKYVFLHTLVATGASEEYIIDQILTIILAGRDTTATAISSVLWFLARDPVAVERLRQEIMDVGVVDPTFEQLRDMKYLARIVKEALRLFPPVPFNGRRSVRDTILPRGGGPGGDLPIFAPKGTTVRFNLYTMHRREDIYGPDAQEFRPDRWEDPALMKLNWEYLPFHRGPRVCIGQQFALTQTAYTIYKIFQKFKGIRHEDNRPLTPHLKLTASLEGGCWVSMEDGEN